MHAQGADPMNSITLLKEVDKLAQLAYDIQFALPPSPNQPVVTATASFEEIILNWDNIAESYTAVDNLDLLPVAALNILPLPNLPLRTTEFFLFVCHFISTTCCLGPATLSV